MADMMPFRGVRFGPGAGDLGALIAPPYDVISPERQRRLYDRSRFNIVRMEYGESRPSDGESDDRYTRAAADLQEWLEKGALEQDPAPAFYVYEQEFEHAGRLHRRTAVFGRVRLEEWEKGVVKPHEYTMTGPKADRLSLMKAVRGNISPVLGLVRDGQGALRGLPGQARAGAPVAAGRDDAGNGHRLWRVDDAAACRRVTAALAGESIYVADGHHRYETALAYRDFMRSTRGEPGPDYPENFVLMALVAIDDPGLLILPIHRLVRSAPLGEERLDSGLPGAFEVQAEPEGLDRLLAWMAAAPPSTTVLGLVRPGRLERVALRDREVVERGMPAGTPAAWRRLDVNVAQYGILEPLLGINAQRLTAGSYVEFSEDAHEAAAGVSEGRYRLAILLNPTRVDQVLEVADAGARMPQKSTFFYPKLGTGLVLYLHR